jgi:hypothetical protein
MNLVNRNLAYFIDEMKIRSQKFPWVIGQSDVENVIKNSLQVLNNMVNLPRILIIRNPIKGGNILPPDVDEIVNVKFSLEDLDPLIRDFGMMPLITSSFPIWDFEGVTDYLIMKGNLNMIRRQMKTAVDWEVWEGKIVFNQTFKAVAVEYLPSLTFDQQEWYFYPPEDNFVQDLSWIGCNLRNSEALFSAGYLGVAKEYEGVLNYWKDKEDKIIKLFKDSSVISYMG